MELVLGTRHELGLSWITPMLSALESVRKSLTLHLYFGSGPDLIGRVRSVAIDCAVTSSRIVDPKLDGFELHEERYAFVGHTKLLHQQRLRGDADARHHTLFDVTEELPLYRYFRQAQGGIDSVLFGRVVRLGTIAAIRHQVLGGKGVAVLPEYFIRKDLRSGQLKRILPKVRPHADCFRLVHRADDPRKSVFESLAAMMRARPLA